MAEFPRRRRCASSDTAGRMARPSLRPHDPLSFVAMARLFRMFAFSLVIGLLAGCGDGKDGAIDVAIIDTPEALFAPGTRLSPGAQHLRAATAEGLVGLDAAGEVAPGLAERWIITDDGRSYIFRLADRNWPDRSRVTAETVRQSLRQAIRDLKDTSLGLDLARVSEIRAMTDRVVEIRLATPMPDFLQLLAQPELALFRNRQAAGSMTVERVGNLAILFPVAPEMRGLPMQSDWKSRVRPVRLAPLSAAAAVARFDKGEADVVLGGGIENLPLADTGPLSRGTVRLDAVMGLFGLHVRQAAGVLAEPPQRAALAMAIDRAALIAPFNIGGWAPTTRIIPGGMADDLGTIGERWTGLTLEQRRAEAARRIAAWRGAESGRVARVSIAMPEGPGSDLVYERLRADFAAIGVALEKSANERDADLVLVDSVARYASPFWFLNQLHCSLRRGLCSAEADERVAEAARTQDNAARSALLAEAEAELTAANVYIPIGGPIRWSLARGAVTGFETNRFGFHPLRPMADIPR